MRLPVGDVCAGRGLGDAVGDDVGERAGLGAVRQRLGFRRPEVRGRKDVAGVGIVGPFTRMLHLNGGRQEAGAAVRGLLEQKVRIEACVAVLLDVRDVERAVLLYLGHAELVR